MFVAFSHHLAKFVGGRTANHLEWGTGLGPDQPLPISLIGAFFVPDRITRVGPQHHPSSVSLIVFSPSTRNHKTEAGRQRIVHHGHLPEVMPASAQSRSAGRVCVIARPVIPPHSFHTCDSSLEMGVSVKGAPGLGYLHRLWRKPGAL